MNLLGWLGHFSVPHASNNHKARILHPSVLCVIAALFLAGQFVLNYSVLLSPSILGYASDITPEQVIEITNQKRAEQGLPPLKLNGVLSEAARRKAGDMFAFDYWAHRSPSGRDPWSFLKETGYNYLYAGENLARDFMTTDSMVEAWMNSPTHRDNILNGRYQEIGIAVVDGTLRGAETTLVVQLFGTPTPAPVPSLPAAPELGEATITKPVEKTSLLVRVALAQAQKEPGESLVSPFLLTKGIAVFLLGLVLGALVLDVWLVYKRKIVRLSGRSIAHLIFVGSLLLAVILTTPGAIL